MTEKINNIQANKQNYTLILAPPPIDNLKNGYDELRHHLLLENIFELFHHLTGLQPDFVEYRVSHAESTDWEDPNHIFLNYERGFWCYIGAIHELVHIVLRQKQWQEEPELKEFFSKHPEFNIPSRGDGYKLEQMIAYLVQKDCAKYLSDKFGDSKYESKYDQKKFEEILAKEYQGAERERLGRLIIGMWEERDPGEDIVSFAKGVVGEYKKL